MLASSDYVVFVYTPHDHNSDVIFTMEAARFELSWTDRILHTFVSVQRKTQETETLLASYAICFSSQTNSLR